MAPKTQPTAPLPPLLCWRGSWHGAIRGCRVSLGSHTAAGRAGRVGHSHGADLDVNSPNLVQEAVKEAWRWLFQPSSEAAGIAKSGDTILSRGHFGEQYQTPPLHVLPAQGQTWVPGGLFSSPARVFEYLLNHAALSLLLSVRSFLGAMGEENSYPKSPNSCVIAAFRFMLPKPVLFFSSILSKNACHANGVFAHKPQHHLT